MIEEVYQIPTARFSDVERAVGSLESTVSALRRQAQRDRVTNGRLRNLLDATAAIGGDLDMDHLLERIAEAATALVNARYGALGVLQPDGGLEQLVQTGISADDGDGAARLPHSRASLAAVSEHSEPTRLDQLGADFAASHPPMHSFLSVPIRVGDEVVGNLYLADRRDGAFTRLDEDLVGEFAVAAGRAIENARRFEETRRKHRLSAALSEVASTLLSARPEDVLAAVTSKVALLLPSTLVTIIVPGACESEMRVAAAHGLHAHDAVGEIYPAEGSLAAQAVLTGKVITSEGEHEVSSERGSITFGSTVAVPLVVSGRAIGALCIAREPEGKVFTRAERDTVTEFAIQAGLAVALAWARLDRDRLEVIEDHARIARDLHDNVIQRLFATGLGLQALAAEVPEHAEAIDAHTLEIDAAISDIRSAVFLRTSTPPSDAKRVRHRVLDLIVQLTPALGSSPRVAFTGQPNMVIPRQLADDVVAVVRETLMNVAKHARATMTEVDVCLEETGVSISVEDDGIGIGPDVERSSGTRNLARRAERYGGAFTLEPRMPQGTRAQWNVRLGAEGDQ